MDVVHTIGYTHKSLEQVILICAEPSPEPWHWRLLAEG